MKSLTEPLLELESYQSLLDEIRRGHTPVFATGVIDVEKIISFMGCRNICSAPW